MKLQGSFPAVITPFKQGTIDEPALRTVLRSLIRGGSAGLVPCGSTGEAATLSNDEYQRVVTVAVEEAEAKIPVIAGVGTNATWKAVETAKVAESLGVDALLCLVPYYNKPTQEGIFLHFGEIARAVKLPLIVYNIPGRTGVNLQPATLARLAHEFGNVVAVKEAAGSLDQVSEILQLCPKGFTVLSGDDSLTLPMMSVGAKGVISVVANILPKDTAAMCKAFLDGKTEQARKLHLELFPVIKALFLETNPIPVKAAAAMLGLCSDEMRLPMTPLSSAPRQALATALSAYGLKLKG